MTSPFTITQTLTDEQISSALCSALEGGSNYWYRIENYVTPITWTFDSEPKNTESGHWLQDYPLNPGGALMVSSPDDPEYGVRRLDREAIQKGLAILAAKYAWHLGNIMSGNDDAETGDALLQCSLFGEIIYG
jgi:hypothetical protein